MKALLFLFMFVTVVSARDYPATVISCYDGDTITVNISLGLDIFKTETIRLVGIDAPEKPTVEGKAVQKELEALLKGKQVTIKTANDKREKYGRLLADVILNGINVNQLLIKKGLAKAYDGGKRTP